MMWEKWLHGNLTPSLLALKWHQEEDKLVIKSLILHFVKYFTSFTIHPATMNTNYENRRKIKKYYWKEK